MKQLFLSLLLSVPLVEAGKIGGRAQAKGEASSACEPSGMIPITVHRNTIPAEMAAAAALSGKILSDTPELPLQAVRQYSDAGIQTDEIAIPLEERVSQAEMPRTIINENFSFKQLSTLGEYDIYPHKAGRWSRALGTVKYATTSSEALEKLKNILEKGDTIMPAAGDLQKALGDASKMFEDVVSPDQKLEHANNIIAATLALDKLSKIIDEPQATSDASTLLQITKTTNLLLGLALHIKNAQELFARIERQLASDIHVQCIAQRSAQQQKAVSTEECTHHRLSILQKRYALLPHLFTSLKDVQNSVESITATYSPSAELIEVVPQADAAAAADDTDQIDGF